MSLMDDVVLPVLDEMGVHYLRDGKQDNVVLASFELDAASGRQSLVTVVTHDGHHDLKIFAEACRVPAARTPQVLSALNRLNLDWRWTRWLLAPTGTVLIDTDVELTASTDPRGYFGFAFTNLVRELHRHWRDVVRAANQRGRRSRLERQLDEILDGFAATTSEHGEEP